MKPWRPYWKGLELVADRLLTEAEPAPFANEEIPHWVSQLPLDELARCNVMCHNLAETLAINPGAVKSYTIYGPLFGGPRIRWQMILRCYCAIDFCSGRVEKRKQFDWHQAPEAVYRHLLIQFWWGSAQHWAYKNFTRSSLQQGLDASRWSHELSYRLRKVDPGQN